MSDYSPTDLGATIKELRTAKRMPNGKKMTQVELGDRAGYTGGKGVTISRIESGMLVPSRSHLESIAGALNLSITELETIAAKKAAESEPPEVPQGLSLQDRLKKIEEAKTIWQNAVVAVKSFESVREDTNERFLIKLRDIAARIQDIPPNAESDEPAAQGPAASKASYQMELTKLGLTKVLAASLPKDENSGVEEMWLKVFAGAATSAASFLPGAGAAALGELSAALTDRRTTSAGVALAKALVTGGAALALGAAAAAGAKRSLRRQKDYVDQVSNFEKQIEESQPGVDAILEELPRATKLLEYISVHGIHALNRWERSLGEGRLAWNSLPMTSQERYRQLEDVAAAQIAIASLNSDDLFVNRGAALEHARSRARALIDEAERVITEHV